MAEWVFGLIRKAHGGNRVRLSLWVARTSVNWRRRLSAPRGSLLYSPAHRRKGRGHPMRNHGAHAIRLGWRVFMKNNEGEKITFPSISHFTSELASTSRCLAFDDCLNRSQNIFFFFIFFFAREDSLFITIFFSLR